MREYVVCQKVGIYILIKNKFCVQVEDRELELIEFIGFATK